jgi:hypothetical protein
MRSTLVTLLSLVSSMASAASAPGTAPSQAARAEFIQEVEAATKANVKAIAGGSEGIRKHHGLYVELEKRRNAMFADADACSLATQAARAVWVSMLQYDIGPNDFSYKTLAARQQDYRDNLKACWQALNRK